MLGGQVTSALWLANHPRDPMEAATKGYVDTALGLALEQRRAGIHAFDEDGVVRGLLARVAELERRVGVGPPSDRGASTRGEPVGEQPTLFE